MSYQIKQVPLDSSLKALLKSSFTSESYTNDLVTNPVYSHFDSILLLYCHSSLLGYCVVNEVSLKHISNVTTFEEVDLYDFDPDQTYTFIDFLVIHESARGRGLGAYFVNYLRSLYPNRQLYAYVTEDSSPFWERQRFLSLTCYDYLMKSS